MADFKAEAEQREARRQAETHELINELHEEMAREVARCQEETRNAISSLRNDVA